MRKVGIRPRRLGRGLSGRPYLPGSGDRGGGSFLPDVFPDARQWVEAAFGADLTADPDTWSWTDITGPRTVLWDPGVSITIGYPDEALGLVPASFTCDIRNDQPNGGDFTIGNPLGRYWPNIRENTPIRARLDVGNGPTTRFFGYATSWKPRWDAARQMAVVTLKANGTSRRTRQGTSTEKSSARRALDSDSVRPVAYWPLEGGTSNATMYDVITNSPSSVGGFTSLVTGDAGAAQFGTVDAGPGSGKIAGIGGGWNLDLKLPPVTATGWISYEFVTAFGTAVRNVGVTTFGIRQSPYTNTKHLNWNIGVFDDGTVNLRWMEADVGLNLLAGPTEIYNSGPGENIFDGLPRTFRLDLNASGGTDVAYVLWKNDTAIATGTITPSFSGAMNAPPWRMSAVSTVGATDIAGWGHVAAFTAQPHGRYQEVLGHPGETATTRMIRLFAEQGIHLDITGSSDTPMRPQRIGSFTDLVQECAAVDLGILLDGLGPGYTYIARTSAYGRSSSLQLNYAASDLLAADPEQDDQGRNNDYVARDGDGGDREFIQTGGDLGANIVGTYDDSGDHRAANNPDLYQIAAWKVAQGTVGGLRYPRLKFNLAKPGTARLAQQWLDTLPFNRIDALALSTPPDPDRVLLLRGWAEKWNSKIWEVTANVTRYDVFGVVSLAADSGDTDPFVEWLDADGSTVQTGIAAGATSVSVVTSSGPVWPNSTTPSTNYSDDVNGLYINLDGMRVGVTAISGASSPQTFTITSTDVLRAVPPGASVTVWNPVRIGL